MRPAGRYLFSGLIVESDVALLDDAFVASGASDCRIERLPDHVLLPPQEAGGAGVGPMVSRSGDALVLHASSDAAFEISPAGDCIRYRVTEGLPRRTLQHLLLDHVLPRALALRGFVVLHASAVTTPWGAIGFIGASGSGKSTLAAHLGRGGWPFLSDDALVLETRSGAAAPVARPNYRGIRLWPEEARRVAGSEGDGGAATAAPETIKRLLAPADAPTVAFASEPAPLVRLYALAPEGPEQSVVEIAPLGPREALIAMLRQSFRLGMLERTSIERDLERISKSVPARLCRVLRYRRGHAHLPEIKRALTEDLSRDGS
jgi:hypothetical protein